MPRANRYILPGCSYHVTHRCHDRQFLLKFAKDRDEYGKRLREATKGFDLSLLGYCITSNHVHLVINAEQTEAVSRLMQKLEGEFAEYYNRRKKRSGAFWDGRYHCTMVDSGLYLWNCLKYVDLNMVRARVVSHPRDWPWCGYHELVGMRQRYKLLDFSRLVDLHDGQTADGIRENYAAVIDRDVMQGDLCRDPIWTESIAVGGDGFVKAAAKSTENRVNLTTSRGPDGTWTLREEGVSYR